MSESNEGTSESNEGEILKASAPGRDQIQVGMPVSSVDGGSIGRVKEVGEAEFLVDRPLARDLWVPYSVVLAIEDSGNFHGPVQQTAVVLSVRADHIDSQGWRHA
jgi:hypothetical protein